MTSPNLSRSSWRLAALCITASLALGACRKDEEKTDKKPETATAKASAGRDDDEGRTSKRAPQEGEGIDVPTEEDFEEAAANQITPETDLQKELDQLEKEITK